MLCPKVISGANTPFNAQIILSVVRNSHLVSDWRRLVGRACGGTFRCSIDQVQMIKMERQFQTMFNVPRIGGAKTNVVPGGGIVHFGWNVMFAETVILE